MKNMFLLLTIAMLSLGCSQKSPLEQLYTQKTTQQEFDKVMQKIDDQDQLLIIAAAYHAQASGESLYGLTYGQIVEKGRQIEQNFLQQTASDASDTSKVEIVSDTLITKTK